jgi:pimeloyl-ACP methyl ester carboxylesterase
VFDKRGEDIRAVMDAAQVERATLFAYSESAALALVLAAAHPERVHQLVRYSSYARLLAGPENPPASRRSSSTRSSGRSPPGGAPAASHPPRSAARPPPAPPGP